MKKDPINTLLWKFSSKRLEAEAIRDSILAVSGELRFRSKGGASVAGHKNERSIYVKVIRNVKDEFLHSFDWADAFASNAVRNVTTTPIQSLLMINGKWVKKKADAFAKRLSKKYKKNYKAIIKHVYKAAYGRLPSSKELKMSRDYLSLKETTVSDFCQVIFNSSEFLYVR